MGTLTSALLAAWASPTALSCEDGLGNHIDDSGTDQGGVERHRAIGGQDRPGLQRAIDVDDHGPLG